MDHIDAHMNVFGQNFHLQQLITIIMTLPDSLLNM